MNKSQRIVLLNPPGKKIYARDKYCSSVSKANYYWPQVDFIFQSGYLSALNHQVEVLDAIASKQGPQDVLRYLKTWPADHILFLTASASWKEDMNFIKKLKQETNSTITALGGWLLPIAKTALESFDFLDAVLLDFACDDYAKWVKKIRPVRNMVWRENGKIIEGQEKKDNPFEVPLPRHEIFPLHLYLFPLASQKPFTVTNTSVGCPWQCSFCVPGTVPYRTRTIENVIEELLYIQNLGIREVLFHDSTFSAVRSRTIKLLEAMLQKNIKLTWMCQTRVDTVDKELIKLMKKAGCEAIEFGVESGSARILTGMRKNLAIEKIKESFAITHNEGIMTNAFFIIGMPDETQDDVKATIALAKALKPSVASFSVPMPHPGTYLGKEENMESRILVEELCVDDVSPPKLSKSRLSPEEIFKLRNKALVSFYLNPSYILRKILSIRSVYDLKRDASLAISLLKGLIQSYVSTTLNFSPGNKTECPLCGFEAKFYKTERNLNLYKCNCGLVFVHPTPSKLELEKFYIAVHKKIPSHTWATHGEHVYRKLVQKLKKKIGKGRVLDIGSGAGYFLEALEKKGFEAYGVETANLSQNKKIIAKDICDIPPDTAQFDVISMLWVLEHIPHPDEVMNRVRTLLKPQGLLIVRTPNINFIKPIMAFAFLEKIFPTIFKALVNPASNKAVFFELLGPPYHLFGYNKKTLTRLLQGHGFSIREITIDGGLRTDSKLRKLLEVLLYHFAEIVKKITNGKIIPFYDLTVWAVKETDSSLTLEGE